ncbi:MAG: ABC transporter ATP-binding protein [Caldilineaceae bacterium]|nr:ABC transporter ATP-binding protein [Caldilineaceae bacterium]
MAPQVRSSLLLTYFAPQWRRVLLLAVLLVGTLAFQLVNPQLIRYVLDTAQLGAPTTLLALAAGLFILFNLLQAGAGLALNYVGEDVSWTATNALRADLTRHCLRLGMDFHNSHTPGELIERVDGDVSELASFFAQLVLRVIFNLLLIGGVILLLWREDWRMGGAALLYTLLMVAVLQAMQGRNVRYAAAFRAAQASFNGFLEERLMGREDIRANGGEGYVLRGMALAQRTIYQATYRARLFGVWLFSVTHLLFVGATALGFGVGIYLFLHQQITLGTVYLVVYYLAILRDPLEQIRDQIDTLQQSTASMQRIRELLALAPEVDAAAVTQPPTQTEPTVALAVTPSSVTEPVAVRFAQVAFRYAPPTAPATSTQVAPVPPGVLADLSFTVAPGQVLGLLGRTGSGKSTLTRLLFRLYHPTAGQIYLNEQAIDTLPLRVVRRQIGMVTQEVQLFQATLRDNLTLFNPTLADAQILTILQELGLWTWYEAQPQGLATRLHAGGAGLSAGEAQLLAFARVFLTNPGLVILDEASSRLDPATEVLLERATDRLLAGPQGRRTGIIIAHRLHTLQRADLILILDQGRMVEFGPRTALAADPTSHFYRLLQTASTGPIDGRINDGPIEETLL